MTFRLVSQLLLALCCLCFALAIPQQFENTKVIRTFAIKSGIAVEDTGIRAKNLGSEPALAYYFLLPNVLHENAASVSASLRKQKTDLNVVLEGLDADKGIYVYKIDLKEHAVQPNEEILLGVKIAYINSIKPLPKKLPQLARQHTTLNFNSYFLSPYLTKEIKTTLVTPSQGILSHIGALGKSSVNGNKVIYGPYENVEPFSFDIATCHFENSKPLLTVPNLRRDIEVSHWGKNLAVEEHYTVRNDGASLEKEFSRVQYQLTAQVHGQTNVLKGLRFKLPPSAQDPYYRDEVGNVSTSNFRVEKDHAILEIAPRYPLFGGWNYTWNHGYNADLESFVRKSKTTGKHILNVNFIENVNDMLIEKAVVRVILPEGAKNVKVHAPFTLNSEEIVSHFTFFDSTGRVMVVLEKKNAISAHELPIQVEYDYSTAELLRKPFIASTAFFSLFILSIVLGKFTFTIGKEQKKKKE
ncbi:hypothetical protein G6F56_006815 [Rhizopus delemar]|uniref:Dolichyl-diphosphooligosaccharide--protein glycosyltransferase subunit 1 n=1 Tax=Rhizopus stolonifer TaxID=4846 RepID=A0A367IQ83_RHIST|nr:hypothetical protein G6F56_006815 [Rhizopus delemar]RCH79779.1 dolichyl-diphosphooligosaccharide--protein glycosyltransferase subunit 1 [Rhizopus stolonifer]